MKKILLLAALGLLGIVAVVAVLGKTEVPLPFVTTTSFRGILSPFEPEWSPFVMTYTVGGKRSSATNRLTWYSKYHWVDEILTNDIETTAPTIPPLSFAGNRYEFKFPEYLIYEANIVTSTSHIVDGGVMSPAMWLVPGLRESLPQRGFVQTGTTSEGYVVLTQSEPRHCAKNKKGELRIPSCSPEQKVVTELVFEAHGVPMSRRVTVADEVTENFAVTGLVWK
jgi:hypothetical protein